MTNLCIGGAAGDGIETMAGILEKILQRNGFELFSMRDFMSRIRGGHNFVQLRFGDGPVVAHTDALDVLIAFDLNTYHQHQARLKPDGLLLGDPALGITDARLLPIPLRNLALTAGNARTIGVVCIGALLKLLGLPYAPAEAVLNEALAPKILPMNLKALQSGYDAAVQKRQTPLGQSQGRLVLTGAQAMAMGALAGGIQFYAAYPMSPATTLLNFFTEHAPEFGTVVEQAEDEIAAINMALGASYAGARAMTGTSGGGFSLMVEALGFSGIAELPVVIADVQRPGPATGLPTRTEQSDLLFACFASQGEFPRMVIAVRDHADAFYQTARAMQLAQKYQIPVLLLSDQYLADAAATLPPPDAVSAAKSVAPLPQQPDADGPYRRYAYTESGVSPMRVPGRTPAIVRVDSDEHNEDGTITEDALTRTRMVDKRAHKLDSLMAELLEPAFFGAAEPETLLLCFGSTAGAVAEAVAKLCDQGLSVGALAFGDVYPLPKAQLTRYASAAKAVYSVEQNATAQLGKLVAMETGVRVKASVLKYDGRQLSVDDIVSGLAAQGVGKEVPV